MTTTKGGGFNDYNKTQSNDHNLYCALHPLLDLHHLFDY